MSTAREMRAQWHTVINISGWPAPSRPAHSVSSSGGRQREQICSAQSSAAATRIDETMEQKCFSHDLLLGSYSKLYTVGRATGPRPDEEPQEVRQTAMLRTLYPAKYRQRRPRRTDQSLRSKCICLLAPGVAVRRPRGLGTGGSYLFLNKRAPNDHPRSNGPSSHMHQPLPGRRRPTTSKANSYPGAGSRRLGGCNRSVSGM